LKPAQANSSQDPISETPSQKKGWWSGMAQGVGPEIKPQYHKKKKKESQKEPRSWAEV
jgi:hypothetical protein